MTWSKHNDLQTKQIKLSGHCIIFVSPTHDYSSLFSWLLRDPNMEIRTFTSPYLRAVDDYFATLFTILVPLQVLDKLPNCVIIYTGAIKVLLYTVYLKSKSFELQISRSLLAKLLGTKTLS